MTIVVRSEVAADFERVREVETAAFGGPDEAALVDALRREADPVVSLVAEQKGERVGHVFFSPVELAVQPADRRFGALAPVGVDPAHQAAGVGTALIREGLVRARALGWAAVFLVGDPRYYARFGFELAAPRGFDYGHPHFDAALQLLELEPGGLEGCAGRVWYAPVFGQVRPA